jgi:hypothetical protein
LNLPAGYRLTWTGQYEFMAEMEERMRVALPLTLVLIVGLLYLSLRGWAQTGLVLMSLPFAIAGSIWLLGLLHYNLSTAVWVGLIAVGGVAAKRASLSCLSGSGISRAFENGQLQTVERHRSGRHRRRCEMLETHADDGRDDGIRTDAALRKRVSVRTYRHELLHRHRGPVVVPFSAARSAGPPSAQRQFRERSSRRLAGCPSGAP